MSSFFATLGFVSVIVALVLGGYFLITFNRLVALRNACANARAGIDVNLKRRHQLIPNLVSAVRGYLNHEHKTLTAVAELRSQAMASLGQPDSAPVEAALDDAVVQLVARVEAYPELKADGPFINLMKNLTEAEEQISASRRAFNAQVMRMNNLVQQFPSLVVARTMDFRILLPYAADVVSQLAPQVVLPPRSNND